MTVRKIFSDLLDQHMGLPGFERKLDCWCHNCLKDMKQDGWPITLSRMILCPNCGNKRCPRATDHSLACSQSNDPGQTGSRYQ